MNDKNGIGEKQSGKPRREERSGGAVLRIVCAITSALSALAAVICVICYIVYRHDVLFLPIALCAVVAMIAFTYFCNTKGK